MAIYKQVVWRKDTVESPLTSGDVTFTPDVDINIQTRLVSDTESHWNLSIANVGPEDAGSYQCQVFLDGTRTINLHVLCEYMYTRVYQ